MKKSLLLASALLSCAIAEVSQAANQCKRVEAFYPSWRTSTSPISSINWNALHGLKVAFAFPTDAGGLSTSEVDLMPLSTVVSNAHAHGTRVILSIGGAGADHARSSGPFLNIVDANSSANGGRQARLTNFANAVKNYVVANNIDGVDIDWENWTGVGGAEVASEGQGLVDLLGVLRDTLPPTVSLSADVLTGSWNGGNYLAAMTKNTDYIHLMTYDYTGQWSSSPIKHHAALDDVNAFTATEKTKYAGEPLMLGMPYYGKEFVNSGNATVNTWIYKDIVTRAQQLGVNINSGVVQGPQGPIYYETPDLAKQKASKVFGDSQLIGLFSWELSQDTTDASKSLLSAVSTVLNKCVDAPPAANAGPDQTVNKGDTVNLSVSGTDPENDQLTYYWEQVSGTTVTINNKRTVNPSISIPTTAAGTALTFKASVCDTSQACGADTIVVNVKPDIAVNHAPVVNASNVTVTSGQLVNLSATASDADGDAMTYIWSPAAGLSGANTLNASYTAPTVTASTQTTYTITVCDTKSACTSKAVVVTVNPVNANLPPVVNASNVTVTSGQLVNLSATATDPNGDPMTYSWSPSAGLTGATTLNASFTAPTVTAQTQSTYTITACDNKSACTSKSVVVTVNPIAVNHAPVVNAANVTVNSGQVANLSATATDADGDAMTYSWTPSAGVSGATSLNASFTAPSVTVDTALNYTFTACDSKSACASKVVVVTVKPVSTNQCAPAYAPYPTIYNAGDVLSYQGHNYKALEGSLYNIPPTMAGQSFRYQDLGACN
jgi:GH18 family chitinase